LLELNVCVVVPLALGMLDAHAGEPTSTQTFEEFLYHSLISEVTATIA